MAKMRGSGARDKVCASWPWGAAVRRSPRGGIACGMSGEEDYGAGCGGQVRDDLLLVVGGNPNTHSPPCAGRNHRLPCLMSAIRFTDEQGTRSSHRIAEETNRNGQRERPHIPARKVPEAVWCILTNQAPKATRHPDSMRSLELT